MLQTRLSRPDLDDPALHARWQALAAVSAAPLFRSWTWVGCRAHERFPEPLLAEAFDDGHLVGMALFNRRGRSLFLHTSGDPALDSAFIEHNGPVATHPGAFAAILASLHARQVVLPGLDDDGLATVRRSGGIAIGLHTRPAPYVSLAASTPHVGALSRNTRAQLRRSDRSYAVAGPIVAERAPTAALALDWLDAMMPLHTAAWSARGVASGFAAAPVQRFIHDLLARGVPTGEVDMLRIAAGPRVVGYLVNFRNSTSVLAYQSGFDYAGAAPHEKPGLTCHHAAIEQARQTGAVEYDFLAGDARYKRSLGTKTRNLHWLTWKPRPFLFGIEAVLRRALGR